MPFVCVELASRDALERARVEPAALDRLAASGVSPDIHLYWRSGDAFDVRCRMFAPLDGVPEDPATGSANCALTGLLASLESDTHGTWSWRIAQGVEMGRPSELNSRARKSDGAVTDVWIGGDSVRVSEGWLELDG